MLDRALNELPDLMEDDTQEQAESRNEETKLE